LKIDYSKLTHQQDELGTKLQIITKKIERTDPDKIQTLKIQKKKIWEQQISLDQSIPQAKIFDFWNRHKADKLLEQYDGSYINPEQISLFKANQLINYILHQWKVLKQENNTLEEQAKNILQTQKHFDQQLHHLELKDWTHSYQLFGQQIQNLEQKHLSDIQNIDVEISNLWKQEEQANIQIRQTKDKLNSIEQTIQNKSKFQCSKIHANCPFVQEINKSSFEIFAQQKQQLNDEIVLLQEDLTKSDVVNKIKKLKNNRKDKEKILSDLKRNPENILEDFISNLAQKKKEILSELDSQNLNSRQKEIESQKHEITTLLEILRDFLQDLEWRQLQNNFELYQQKEQEKQAIDQQISKLEMEAKQLEDLKIEQEKAKIQIKEKQTQTIEITKLVETIRLQINETQQSLGQFDISKTELLDQNNK